jgi:parallel beta-helix repeat protein
MIIVRSGLIALGLVCFSIPAISADARLSKPEAAINSIHFVAVTGSDGGPGTADQPWATINHAADVAVAGDTIVVRGGRYVLSSQVRPKNSGRPGAWISFVGSPGEEALLDAQKIPTPSFGRGALNNGAFQVERTSYVRLANLRMVNSHDAGITIRDSSYIELINNMIRNTFSSGIAVWDTNHDDRGTEHIRIIGNTIIKATTWDLAPVDVPRQGEPPHEALSIGGAVDFEVAYNHIYDSDKEGIDIKETSKRGLVHHNLIDNVDRQGIYLDAAFGIVRDIEVFSNVVHHCRGAGLAVSGEAGTTVQRINVHNNLIFENDGSGLYFSRWGADRTREEIRISNNVFFHNGYGPAEIGQTYRWQTGGIYLYSTSLKNLSINDNVISQNRGFQIGYSELFLKDGLPWEAVAHRKNITIDHNVVFSSEKVEFPIESGGAPYDRVNIYAVNGTRPITSDPKFDDPSNQDFALRTGFPADKTKVLVGPIPPKGLSPNWWRVNFPPKLSE